MIIEDVGALSKRQLDKAVKRYGQYKSGITEDGQYVVRFDSYSDAQECLTQ